MQKKLTMETCCVKKKDYHIGWSKGDEREERRGAKVMKKWERKGEGWVCYERGREKGCGVGKKEKGRMV